MKLTVIETNGAETVYEINELSDVLYTDTWLCITYDNQSKVVSYNARDVYRTEIE